MAIEIVVFPIKNGDFPWQNVCSPEGNPCQLSLVKQCQAWKKQCQPSRPKATCFQTCQANFTWIWLQPSHLSAEPNLSWTAMEPIWYLVRSSSEPPGVLLFGLRTTQWVVENARGVGNILVPPVARWTIKWMNFGPSLVDLSFNKSQVNGRSSGS